MPNVDTEEEVDEEMATVHVRKKTKNESKIHCIEEDIYLGDFADDALLEKLERDRKK